MIISSSISKVAPGFPVKVNVQVTDLFASGSLTVPQDPVTVLGLVLYRTRSDGAFADGPSLYEAPSGIALRLKTNR